MIRGVKALRIARSSNTIRLYSSKQSNENNTEQQPQQPKQDKQPKKSVKEIDDEMLSKLKDRDPGQEEIEEGNIGGGLKHHVRAQKFRLI